MTAIFESLQTIANQTANNSQGSVDLVDEQYGAIQEITASSHMLAKLKQRSREIQSLTSIFYKRVTASRAILGWLFFSISSKISSSKFR